MKTIKKILTWLIDKPQYYVPIGSLIVFFVIRWCAIQMKWYSFDPGYWQSIFFGILGASIITWAAYIMFAAWQPHLKHDIDSDPESFKKLSPWERALLAFLFVALFVWSATQLASGL